MMFGIVLAITGFDNPYLFVTGFVLFVANMLLFYVAIVDRENMNQK
ncbi:hypothetical protein [Paenisporosarcina sp. HGH0030]|nr:hypothetical protein [Paenisporosarcina sp. HGH0030]